MNKFLFMGRIASDPTRLKSADGADVIRFSFAVSRGKKIEGQPDADFFKVIAFRKVAESLIRFDVGKGTKLLLDGEIRNNNYLDKQGVKHYENEFVINKFEFAESKKSREVVDQPVSVAEVAPAEDEDEFPF